MRLLILLPLSLLAACQVSKDSDNGTITAEFNQDVAENAARDVANGAEALGGAIVNEAEQTADKIDNTDIDVSVDTNTADNRN
ncbi:MAG TPA: hypothetical protein VFK50_10140 [Sphingomicrobium sp.]|nr:hypothetical protein [Sphingomicrobium sp.]